MIFQTRRELLQNYWTPAYYGQRARAIGGAWWDFADWNVLFTRDASGSMSTGFTVVGDNATGQTVASHGMSVGSLVSLQGQSALTVVGVPAVNQFTVSVSQAAARGVSTSAVLTWRDVTKPTAAGDPIGRVLDKWNSNHLGQTIAANRADWNPLTNGLYGLDFDGVDDNYTGPLITSSLVYTTYAILVDDPTATNFLYNGVEASNGYGLYQGSLTSTPGQRAVLAGGVVFREDGVPSSVLPTIWAARRDTATSMQVNGVDVALTNAAAAANVPTTGSKIGNTSSAIQTGPVGEWIFVAEYIAPDSLIDQLFMNYLRRKWGIAT